MTRAAKFERREQLKSLNQQAQLGLFKNSFQNPWQRGSERTIVDFQSMTVTTTAA